MTENLENNNKNLLSENSKRREQNFVNETEQQNYATEQNQETKNFVAYGGFWRRIASNGLDIWPTWIASIFFYVYLFMAIDNFYEILDTSIGDPMSQLKMIFISYIILLVIYLINTGFNIYFYFKNGETLGYKILGMKIISEKNGEKPTTGELWGRFGMKFLFFALMIIPIINILAIIFYVVWATMLGVDKRKQGLHEKPAKTLVVMEEIKRVWVVWVVNLLSLILILFTIWLLWIIAIVTN